MTQPISYGTPTTPRRLSQAALWSMIFGILGCIPFATGALAVLLGLVGIVTAGRPNRRGRWMAVVGLLLGLLSLTGWLAFGGAAWGLINVGSKAIAVMKAPGDATHDFIQAVAASDEPGEKAHSAMSDESLKEAETMIRAQGGFVDSTFNNIFINEGSSAHVEGTARFQSPEGPMKTLNVKADLTQVGGQWKVESTQLLPAGL